VPTLFPPQVIRGPLGLAGGGSFLYQRKISDKAIIQNKFLNLMAAISFINQNIHFPAANEFFGKQ